MGTQRFRGIGDGTRQRGGFISLSPNDHPLPDCLKGAKKDLIIGGRNFALFPSRDGKPLLVGGQSNDFNRRILRYDGTSDSWAVNSTIQMGGPVQSWDFHPEVGFIIANAGGFSFKVEFTDDHGQTMTNLPDYPIKSIYPGAAHWQQGCVVIVNKTTAFFAGGISHFSDFRLWDLKETFYLNMDTKKYTRGPDLTLGVHAFTCSLISKPFPQIVIVGGRRSDASSHKTVQILNLATNTFTKGPDIPLEGGTFSHSEVVRNNKVMIIGGKAIGEKAHFDITEYDGQVGSWTTPETKLPARHLNGPAMLIDNMDLCTLLFR